MGPSGLGVGKWEMKREGGNEMKGGMNRRERKKSGKN